MGFGSFRRAFRRTVKRVTNEIDRSVGKVTDEAKRVTESATAEAKRIADQAEAEAKRAAESAEAEAQRQAQDAADFARTNQGLLIGAGVGLLTGGVGGLAIGALAGMGMDQSNAQAAAISGNVQQGLAQQADQARDDRAADKAAADARDKLAADRARAGTRASLGARNPTFNINRDRRNNQGVSGLRIPLGGTAGSAGGSSGLNI